MRKISLLFFLFLSLTTFAQQSVIKESLTLKSSITSIYLLIMVSRIAVILYCTYYTAIRMTKRVGRNLAKCSTLQTKAFKAAKHRR